MADSEASGEARLDRPVDDPVDTDHSAGDSCDDVDVSAADTEFGHLFNDPEPDPDPVEPEWLEWLEVAAPTDEERTFDGFDAFNASTWNFKPTPTPWYHTGRSFAVLIAASIAVVALIVSGVLLAFHRSSAAGGAVGTGTSAAPTIATAKATTTIAKPPLPPPPPPLPPPQSASQIKQAPVYPRTPQTTQTTKKPETNVTRPPFSVHPPTPTKHP